DSDRRSGKYAKEKNVTQRLDEREMTIFPDARRSDARPKRPNPMALRWGVFLRLHLLHFRTFASPRTVSLTVGQQTRSTMTLANFESLESRRLCAGIPDGNVFVQTNLVSDGAVTAAHTDVDLKNPWGVSYLPSGPFWISDNGTSKTTVYDNNGIKALSVNIPGGGGQASAPTGQVQNPFTNAFVVTKGNASGA